MMACAIMMIGYAIMMIGDKIWYKEGRCIAEAKIMSESKINDQWDYWFIQTAHTTRRILKIHCFRTEDEARLYEVMTS